MRPILFEIFGTPIPAWHLLFAAAMLAGYALAIYLARYRCPQKTRDSIPFLFMLAYVFGWLGARFLGIVTEEKELLLDGGWLLALFSFGPMTFYGGAILGAVATIIALIATGKTIRDVFDIAIPSVVLGLGIGRIGCFLNGCDYGREASASAWWTHLNPVLEDQIYRYPTQLEESIFSVTLASVASIWIVKTTDLTKRRTGFIGACTLFATSAHRFVQESFRGDFRGSFFGTVLSTSQGVSLILAACALILALLFFKKQGVNQ